MKVGNVSIGRRACLKTYSICLPGSKVEDEAQLGSLSLLMKGEVLPEGTAWEGAPVVPRAKRGVFGSEVHSSGDVPLSVL
jgi:acetyltransferase-like isoleucine patch superfamily enzyme